jgi:hypothetical protein
VKIFSISCGNSTFINSPSSMGYITMPFPESRMYNGNVYYYVHKCLLLGTTLALTLSLEIIVKFTTEWFRGQLLALNESSPLSQVSYLLGVVKSCSPKWSLPFWSTGNSFVCFSYFSHTCNTPGTSHRTWFVTLKIFCEKYKIMKLAINSRCISTSRSLKFPQQHLVCPFLSSLILSMPQ